MRIAAHGLAIEVPAGWEARVEKRGYGAVLHVASFALHGSDGDFGAAATGRMRSGDAFAALVEYVDRESIRPGVGLYAARRPPSPALHEFAPTALQVTRPGQLGWQRFFTHGGRTCVLYAVIKPGAERPARLVRRLGGVLSTLEIQAWS